MRQTLNKCNTNKYLVLAQSSISEHQYSWNKWQWLRKALKIKPDLTQELLKEWRLENYIPEVYDDKDTFLSILITGVCLQSPCWRVPLSLLLPLPLLPPQTPPRPSLLFIPSHLRPFHVWDAGLCSAACHSLSISCQAQPDRGLSAGWVIKGSFLPERRISNICNTIL